MLATCPACAHQHDIGEGPPPEQSILVCSECGGRTAYGVLLPRIVVEPFVDANGRELLRQRFQDPVTKADVYVATIDPQYAASHAKNILALVLP